MSAPAVGADHYFEVGFTAGAGSLAPGADTGEMKLQFYKTDWSNYDENDDFSYDPAATSWTDAPQVALYRGGVLVWGSEPDGGGAGGAGGTGGTGGAGGGTDALTFTVELPAGVGLHSVVLGGTEAVLTGT